MLPRGVVILLGLAATTVTVAGMRGVSGILAPAFFALMLAVTADPLRGLLERRGMARWLATIIALIVVYAVLLLLCFSMVIAGARFAALIPTYADEFAAVVADVTRALGDLGVTATQVEALSDALDLSQVAGLITELFAAILSLASDLFFIVTLILFMGVDARGFAEHLTRIRGERPAFVVAMVSFASGTRRYLLVSTAFGLIVAVIDTVVLWALDVPEPMVWGLLAFITNYVPNIGFILGLVPPSILALLEGGPGLMLAVIAAYCVINVVIQSFIQPKVVGDAVGLSASMTFLSLVVWTWILGPLGAILAIPLSLLVKALMIDVDPGTRWVSGLIGSPVGGSVPAAAVGRGSRPTPAE
jgi:predicted PurR-regulated permease PerM